MISDARGIHVSPGIYTEEKDVTYSVKSLGITSLGLVGETLYGPAFENIEIENWGQFVDYFGGTSPEKFKNGAPKYELPYVAKSYLEESTRLNVVRVLGLSGYDAGKAWVIYNTNSAPVVILRGKLVYGFNNVNPCEQDDPEHATEIVTNVTVGPYEGKIYNSACAEIGSGSADSDDNKFAIKVTVASGYGYKTNYTYNVSMNPADSDYIYKVLSSNPEKSNAPIYIEAVYENSWNGSKLNAISSVSDGTANVVKYYTFESATSGANSSYTYTYTSATSVANVERYTGSTLVLTGTTPEPAAKYVRIEETMTITGMYKDFKEMYRPAQTPWIVSDVSASDSSDNKSASMRKLFKFVTISDGNASNFQIKVSIQNIRVDEGLFDVVVRDFNDDDTAPVVLERFSKCSLVEGDASFIAFKIGTVDGGYASKSKYIAVEMASEEDMSNCIPAGFLGYPMPSYGNSNKLNMAYNTLFDASIKPKRQYFGLNRNVIDEDILKYKGRYFYNNAGDANPTMICNGFHMDSILSQYTSATTFVDGENGYEFSTVSVNKVGSETNIPRLIRASYIDNTIYKDINVRKFTVYFYGGFDGWDINREQRTNTDKYKASVYDTTHSNAFTKVSNNGLNEILDLPLTAITSDYYAYLAGFRRFANPQDVDINLFATPGIDWYNNTLLTEDALDIIEDADDGRGGDALYIMNAPREISKDEVVDLFESTEIDTSYAATYYPWVMYYDNANKKYLDLPVTKDVVRNMARTDNESFPWFAPAGKQRGDVKCVKAAYKTTLADEDNLYEGRINPVKTFGEDGVFVWGNKTAYTRESPLNRVNVRRLMIRVKKLITAAATHLIFEQYDDTLEKQFKGLVEPILADVKSNRGIYDYRVITEVTPETRDQHILPAKILIKPTPALEYISISFVVYPESVDFSE